MRTLQVEKFSKRRGRRFLKQVSSAEKADIAHAVLVRFEAIADVAQVHRAAPSLVRRLVRQIEKNPQYLQELWTAEQ